MTMTANGFTKLIEELGELQAVCGKKLAYFSTDIHPDGAGSLSSRLEEEMADVKASCLFVAQQLSNPLIAFPRLRQGILQNQHYQFTIEQFNETSKNLLSLYMSETEGRKDKGLLSLTRFCGMLLSSVALEMAYSEENYENALDHVRSVFSRLMSVSAMINCCATNLSLDQMKIDERANKKFNLYCKWDSESDNDCGYMS